MGGEGAESGTVPNSRKMAPSPIPDTSKPLDQAFVLDALGSTSFATGHIRQTLSGANLILDFNTDADPQIEMRIVLLNHGPLTAADLML